MNYNFHAERPHCINFTLFAKNTCVPPGQAGYVNGSACRIGAFLVYVVDVAHGLSVAMEPWRFVPQERSQRCIVPRWWRNRHVMSSRLLGRAALLIPVGTLEVHLRSVMCSSNDSWLLSVGLQGGKGGMNVPEHTRGTVDPIWRSTYLHVAA